MSKRKKKLLRKKAGLSPGSLVFTGREGEVPPVVHQILFSPEFYSEQTFSADINLQDQGENILWIDVRSLHNTNLLESIGNEFKLHSLVMEDIFNVQQRPKFEEYPGGIFVIARALHYDEASLQIETEQVSIFFGKNFILSFQENIDDTFEAIRERIKSGRGRIRTGGTDYLAYALLDKILDDYFHILDKLEIVMEKLEDDITSNPNDGQKSRIHDLKFQLLYLRKSVVPLREAINGFSRNESDLVKSETGLFLRDLYDHAIRIADLVDTFRDIATGLQDLYLSELSMRMNKVMQLLTIVTTVFVPLTFIVGIYGMNFKFMPELEYKYSYPITLIAMFILAMVLLIIFRKRKWL